MRINFNRAEFDRQDNSLKLYADDLKALLDLGRAIEPGKDVEITIGKPNKKRSNDANSYAWELISKLADWQGLTATEVYKLQVKEMPKFADEVIHESQFEENKKDFEKGHCGRLYEKLRDTKEYPGFIVIRKHYGSSDFNTREMSKFIDLLIFECQQAGIETRSPEEIKRLVQAWQ